MSALLNLRYLAEYVLLRGVIAFVRAFPLDMAREMSARTWRLLAPYGRRHARALDNLAIAFPEKSAAEREAIALEMWGNLGRVMAETMLLDRILKQPERIEIENPELLGRYQGKMGAAIACSLHMGNWELAMWPLTRVGAKPAAVYRLVDNPYIDLYLRGQRTELYPGGLFARGKMNGMKLGHDTARMIASYVREGGRLGFLADRYEAKGIKVPFFGKPAGSNVVPVMLARRAGARLWAGRCIRVGNESRFRVRMVEIKVPWTDDPNADITAALAALQAQFEAWIREHPEQWMWSNRRWS
ncbi:MULTISPECIES: lysophospholipid acyltransferase family protein [Rhodomicrobium]|uniref:lysophospholipid acyltransferase family protein n=1 Tax=Rhodomicrobium TaxID=1068 RepID=UPI000B4B16EE|nr:MULTISPECIES: lysophospholipid acyltransferase family protein [Rhodomicrobium]